MSQRDNIIHSERKAFLAAGLGVLGFSGSLPATRLAVAHLDPLTVGLGRAVVAAVLASLGLLLVRAPRPRRAEWPGLLVVAATVVVGFPVISAYALRGLPAGRSAVVIALAPLATAAFAALFGGERPGRRFWLSAGIGAAAILAFVAQGAGGPTADDALLGAAALVVGLGYAEGARLSRRRPGWQVIGWALVIAAPPLLLVTPWPDAPSSIPTSAWLGFAYVSVVSMFLGFVAWYSGLGRGGAARMGQLQLLQPFLTLLWSATLLGEAVGPGAVAAAGVVVGCIAFSWRGRSATQVDTGTTSLAVRPPETLPRTSASWLSTPSERTLSEERLIAGRFDTLDS